MRRLYKKGRSKDYVLNVFKMIDWTLALPEVLALKFKDKLHKLEKENNVSYITSVERLSKEEGLQQGLRQGREEGRHEEAISIAKNLLAEGMSPQAVQKLTSLPKKEVMELVNKH